VFGFLCGISTTGRKAQAGQGFVVIFCDPSIIGMPSSDVLWVLLQLEKLKKPIPEFPLLAKIDVAVQTLCKCCIGQDVILEEDRMLLRPILKACFSEATSSMIEDALSPYLEKKEVVGPGVSDAVTG
jgi:hypothetical protein